jgi:hypothetical protein
VNRKLIVFVPPEAFDDVRDAIFAAGAGRLEDVITALRGAHPYEEPAFDVMPLL